MTRRSEASPADTQAQRCKPLLGTYVEVNLTGPLERAQLLALSQVAFDRMQSIHTAMSFHEAGSELSKLNRSVVNEWVEISADMRAVLSFSLAMSAASDGVFDITVAGRLVELGLLPKIDMSNAVPANWRAIELGEEGVRFGGRVMIDLGGVAKGYAVDMAVQALKEAVPETVRFSVNAGGDLRFSHPEQERVHIRTAEKNGGTIILKPPFASVATSASYFIDGAPSAIIDPFSAVNIEMERRSVSVFAESCMRADALTKVVALLPDTATILEAHTARALVLLDGRSRWVN